ncbi:MAG TPA: TolC family protein, partial [Candidatus Acidoferrum sp.]|nr:TolC family protein [Candidatus Acidoferrum sp.]
YMRVFGILALVLAVTISPVAPAFAQQQGTMQQGTQQQTQAQPQQQTQPPPPAQPKKISDQDPSQYSHGKKAFPNMLLPYSELNIPQPDLNNTTDLQQFIHDGKLNLGLQDCVMLALENNLDIQVQRYLPWIADTSILSAKSGTGTNLAFDPIFRGNAQFGNSATPVSNPFLSGAQAGLSSITSHTDLADFSYNQGFYPGTSFTVTMNNTHQSSNSTAFTFNPSLQSTLTVAVTQELLNGFGILPNKRLILVAQNNRKISDLQFQQLVITTITSVEDDYWNYVFTIKQIAVAQQSLAAAQTLYDSNVKQEKIGTMAPLDVITAKAQVATANTQLIQAQTQKRQAEVVLLSVITKNPLAQGLSKLEIVPTDDTYIPDVVENVSLDDAVKEALASRPDYKQFPVTLNSDDITVRATHNGLLPTLNVTGQYGWTGLAGHQVQTTGGAVIPGEFVANLNDPVVNSSGVVIPNEFGGVPATTPVVQTTNITGLTDVFSQIGSNQFPSYLLAFSLIVPIRNRAAQANNIQAILQKREDTVQLQRQQNIVVVDVHTAQIQLEQARASLASAIQSTELEKESYEDEVKKLQLGTSSNLLVIQALNAYTAAGGVEAQARVTLVEAKVNFDRAMGRLLNVNNIQISDRMKKNTLSKDSLIPGTRANGDLVMDGSIH